MAAPRRRRDTGLRRQATALERQLRSAIREAAIREREDEQSRLLYRRQAIEMLENDMREISSSAKIIDQMITDLTARISALDSLERVTIENARSRLGANLLPEPDTRESAIRAAVSALKVSHGGGTPLPTDACQSAAERLLAALRQSTASASLDFTELAYRKTTR